MSATAFRIALKLNKEVISAACLNILYHMDCFVIRINIHISCIPFIRLHENYMIFMRTCKSMLLSHSNLSSNLLRGKQTTFTEYRY